MLASLLDIPFVKLEVGGATNQVSKTLRHAHALACRACERETSRATDQQHESHYELERGFKGASGCESR